MQDHTIVPKPTEEEAFQAIINFMLDLKSEPAYGYDVYLPTVMEHFLSRSHSIRGFHEARASFPRISPSFFAASWDLARRGIIRPGVREYQAQATDEGSAGSGFCITPFGRQWLKESGGRFDYVPTEPGRFAQMLDAFTPRFGAGFKQRGQEAAKCYGAHAYLACSAMSGAAVEAILLAVAIQKTGDKARVEKDYLAAGGRGRIEKLILGKQPPMVAEEFRGFTRLLKYWRDATAHGTETDINDNQAFYSLITLLRFAHFVNDRWDDLTK